MAFAMNDGDVLYDNDVNAFINAFQRFGIISNAGCGVVQRAAGANMSVDVDAGYLQIGTGLWMVFNQNLVIPTAGSFDRIDLVEVGAGGSVFCTTGTQSTITAVEPNTTANRLRLAVVYVASGAASIADASITDKRVFLGMGYVESADTVATNRKITHLTLQPRTVANPDDNDSLTETLDSGCMMFPDSGGVVVVGRVSDYRNITTGERFSSYPLFLPKANQQLGVGIWSGGTVYDGKTAFLYGSGNTICSLGRTNYAFTGTTTPTAGSNGCDGDAMSSTDYYGHASGAGGPVEVWRVNMGSPGPSIQKIGLKYKMIHDASSTVVVNISVNAGTGTTVGTTTLRTTGSYYDSFSAAGSQAQYIVLLGNSNLGIGSVAIMECVAWG